MWCTWKRDKKISPLNTFCFKFMISMWIQYSSRYTYEPHPLIHWLDLCLSLPHKWLELPLDIAGTYIYFKCVSLSLSMIDLEYDSKCTRVLSSILKGLFLFSLLLCHPVVFERRGTAYGGVLSIFLLFPQVNKHSTNYSFYTRTELLINFIIQSQTACLHSSWQSRWIDHWCPDITVHTPSFLSSYINTYICVTWAE